MKKLLATILAIYVIGVSFVLVTGFLQKQSKEDDVAPQAGSSQPAQAGSGQQPVTTTSKSFTNAEVIKHNNSSNCWLIIGGKVYDVTNFLSQHPGGAGTILSYCGKEATRAFDTKDQSFGGGHSSGANTLLQDYLIGTLSP